MQIKVSIYWFSSYERRKFLTTKGLQISQMFNNITIDAYLFELSEMLNLMTVFA